MNASKLARFMGCIGEINGPGAVFFEVEIKDARERLGNLEFLVAPRFAGRGTGWVSASRVRLLEDQMPQAGELDHDSVISVTAA